MSRKSSVGPVFGSTPSAVRRRPSLAGQRSLGPMQTPPKPPLPSKAPASDFVDVDVQFEDLVERAIEYVLGQNLRRRRCCVRSCACAISRLLSRGVCVCVWVCWHAAT